MTIYSLGLTALIWKKAIEAKSPLYEISFNFCVTLMEGEKNIGRKTNYFDDT